MKPVVEVPTVKSKEVVSHTKTPDSKDFCSKTHSWLLAFQTVLVFFTCCPATSHAVILSHLLQTNITLFFKMTHVYSR